MKKAFLILGVALFLYGTIRAQAPMASTIPAPPPMGVIPDGTNVYGGVAAYLSQVQQQLAAGSAWNQWAQDSLNTIGALQLQDEAKIAALATTAGAPGPAGPQGPAGADGAPGPQGPQGIQGPAGTSIPGFTVAAGYTINVQGNAASCSKSVLSRSSTLLQFQQADLPFFCDFLVFAPMDGNYTVNERVAVASGAGTVTAHYELPIGTSVSSWKYTNTNTSANFPVATAPIPLKQGFQVLRLVIDASVDGWEQINWIALTKQ